MMKTAVQNPLLRNCFAVMLLVVMVLYFQNWELIGFEGAEVYGHVWSHTWRFQNFPDSFLGTDAAIGSENFPIIDIIPALLSHTAHFFVDWSSAYNLMVIFFVVMAFVGGWYLAKNEEGDPFVAGLVLVASPIFWGSINSGLTEDFAIGLVALVMVFRNKNPWILGLLLGVLPYCGLVLAWMGLILFLFLMIFELFDEAKSSGFQAWFFKHFKTVMTTLFMTIPLFWLHHDRLLDKGHRLGQHPMQENPFWMLNPWRHNDVASLFSYHSPNFDNEIIRLHPSFIGLVSLLIILKAKSKKWWMAFGFCLLLSFGEEFYWMGKGTGISNPMSWLMGFLPGYNLLNHQGRWMLMALICMAVLLCKALRNIQYRNLVLMLMIAEWWVLGPMGFVMKGTAISPKSTVLQNIPTSSRMIHLPMMGPEISFQKPLWAQRIHHQKLWLSPNHPGLHQLIKLSPQSLWLEQLAVQKEIPNDFCIPKGIDGILVEEPYIALISSKMKQPMLRDEHYAFWSVSPKNQCQ